MRRKHSEVTDRKEIQRILHATTIGRMATNGADGYPYITPVNFVLLGENIYFHSAPAGEKLENIKRDPRVCFEVDIPLAYMEAGFNPLRDPCRTHQLYHCVVIRGTASVVSDESLKVAALNALVAKHEGNAMFEPVTPESPPFKACAVVEVRPENISAKSDLLQNRRKDGIARTIARKLAERGLPGDLEAVRAMGYELEGDDASGWSLKENE